MPDSPSHPGWLALGLVPGLGSRNAGKLLGAFGGPDAIFRASLTELEALGLKAEAAQAIHSREPLRRAEKELARVRALDCRLITWNDPAYPRLLREIYDPPTMLYLRGNPAVLDQHAIGIVGTRRPTPYGNQMSERLARDLAARKLAIVSGLALWAYLRFTVSGRAASACGESALGSRIVGIDNAKFRRRIFIGTAVIAAVFGIVESPITGYTFLSGATISVTGFIAAAYGGFQKPGRALVAGLAVGVLEALLGGYVSTEYADTLMYAVLATLVLARPRAMGFEGYSNGSAIQLFIPRSRSVMTKTGVWNSSARSKASMAIEKHSSTEQGNNIGCLVSPWERKAFFRTSPCAVRVGSPVDGPTRCTSKMTAGISA